MQHFGELKGKTFEAGISKYYKRKKRYEKELLKDLEKKLEMKKN